MAGWLAGPHSPNADGLEMVRLCGVAAGSWRRFPRLACTVTGNAPAETGQESPLDASIEFLGLVPDLYDVLLMPRGSRSSRCDMAPV